MKTGVFISYSSRDGAVDDAMLRLAGSLFSSFSDVYIDRLSARTRWHPQLVIISRVLRSHLLVLIESQSAYRSPWVLLELFLAKITLTPIIKLPVRLLAPQHTGIGPTT